MPTDDRSAFFGVVPVKGIIVSDASAPEIFSSRTWTLIDRSNLDGLYNNISDASSLRSNIDQLLNRLSPDSFLIGKIHASGKLDPSSWMNLVESAEGILSAINFAILCNLETEAKWGDLDKKSRGYPSPVWITRSKEHCELPLIFDKHRLKLSGYSSEISWHTLSQINKKSICNSDIDSILKLTSYDTKYLLKKPTSNRSIHSALRASLKSFESATIGQFVSQSLSSLDLILNAKWNDMVDIADQMFDRKYRNMIEHIFQTRHDFVHKHKEPTDKAVHIRCLALVCGFIKIYETLYIKYKNHDVCRKIIQTRKMIHDIESHDNRIRKAGDMIYTRPSNLPKWIYENMEY